jgi:stage IV sporulation protein B
VRLGGKATIHPGKAKVYSSVDGVNVLAYDIEIIKTNYSSAQAPQNFVFRVVDKELIEATGGIVQGMSGSPIVQDERLVGAVTHVFINDSTKGFGTYIENMLN